MCTEQELEDRKGNYIKSENLWRKDQWPQTIVKGEAVGGGGEGA